MAVGNRCDNRDGLWDRFGSGCDGREWVEAAQLGIAALAPGAVPQNGRVTAIDDVDVYNGPGGTFTVVALMRAGTSASVMARHPDGWCLLSGLGPTGTAWVAEDHLTPARCGAG